MAETCFKIIVVGASGVGKTCITLRLVDGTFDESTQSKIGIQYRSYRLTLDDQPLKLNIWDTAGQERFKSISRSYFRDAVGAILVFAVDNKDSFEEIGNWMHDFHTLAVPNAAALLVGNKCDIQERQVTVSEAEAFAERHGLVYLETSARDGTNVAMSFARLARQIMEKVKRGEIRGEFKAPEAPAVGNSSSNCC